MVYNNFRFKVVVRVLVLVATIIIFSFILIRENFWLLLFFLGILIIYQIIQLIKWVEKSNMQISSFLEAVEQSDYTFSFPQKNENESFHQLYQAMNKMLVHFRSIRKKEEEQRHFLQNILHHLNTAILVVNKNGEIVLINTAAKRLFRINRLHHLEELQERYPMLPPLLLKLEHQEQELIKLQDKEEVLQILVRISHLMLGNQQMRLISLHNIAKELSEQEFEAWHKLIKVLTHEIMNSITPITSLAASAAEIMVDQQEIKNESLEDLRMAINVIKKRSAGLNNFVHTYRSLVKKPEPQFLNFKVQILVQQVCTLLKPKLESKKINIQVIVSPEELKITADQDLLEQVLINLIFNAAEALEGIDNPCIKITAFVNENSRPVIKISDNGTGIHEDVQQQIFIPFFSTKKQGNGIGLSLSYNIIKAHKGNLSVHSKIGEGSEFTITL